MKHRQIIVFAIVVSAVTGSSQGHEEFNVPTSLPNVKALQVSPVIVSAPEFQFQLPKGGPMRIVGGISVWVKSPAGPPVDGLIDLFGTPSEFITARFADQIELVVLKSKTAGALDPKEYLEVESKNVVGADLDSLRFLLTSDISYKWREDSFPFDEYFDYRFRVKFRRQQQVVTMDLCLEKRTVRVVKNGGAIAWKSFEFAYDGVATVIERIFPGETL